MHDVQPTGCISSNREEIKMARTYTLELQIEGDHDREPVLDILRDAVKRVRYSGHPKVVALFTDDLYVQPKGE